MATFHHTSNSLSINFDIDLINVHKIYAPKTGKLGFLILDQHCHFRSNNYTKRCRTKEIRPGCFSIRHIMSISEIVKDIFLFRCSNLCPYYLPALHLFQPCTVAWVQLLCSSNHHPNVGDSHAPRRTSQKLRSHGMQISHSNNNKPNSSLKMGQTGKMRGRERFM